MGWLRLVVSFKLQVSFAKEPCKRDDILRKGPIILRSLLIVATPYYKLSLLSRIQSLSLGFFAKETYNLKETTHRSHPSHATHPPIHNSQSLPHQFANCNPSLHSSPHTITHNLSTICYSKFSIPTPIGVPLLQQSTTHNPSRTNSQLAISHPTRYSRTIHCNTRSLKHSLFTIHYGVASVSRIV